MASTYFIDTMQKLLPTAEREIFNKMVRMGLDGSRFNKVIPNQIDMILPSLAIKSGPDAEATPLPVFSGPSYHSVIRQAWDYMTAHAADGAVIIATRDQGREKVTLTYSSGTQRFERYNRAP